MERFQHLFAGWLDGKPVRVQRRLVAAAFTGACVAAVLGSLLGRNPASITMGSLCGLAMALLLRRGFTILPEGVQDQWNVKERYPFTTRRWLVALLAAGALSVIIGVGQHIPYALGGALTVCVFILLALLFLPTPAELAVMEQLSAEAAEAAELAATVPDWDGNTSGEGGPDGANDVDDEDLAGAATPVNAADDGDDGDAGGGNLPSTPGRAPHS